MYRSGQNGLTHREVQVLELLSRGFTTREVAGVLLVSQSTVRAGMRAIIQKLEVRNRVHAAARAVELGLVSDLDSPPEAVLPDTLLSSRPYKRL